MTAAFKTLDDADLKGKRVLVRVDLNVPMDKGRVTDATRIERVLPTIKEIADKGGKAILLSHFGRPKGGPDKENSLQPLAQVLSSELGKTVAFASDCIGDAAHTAIAAMKDGDVLLLENTRFHKAKRRTRPPLFRRSPNSATSTSTMRSPPRIAHMPRPKVSHISCRRLRAARCRPNLSALSKALEHPAKPVIAVVGGAKVSTKLELLGNLVAKVDALVIGGGMANTFLHAQGIDVGKSLCEKDLAPTAREILSKAQEARCAIILPVDGIVAYHFAADAPRQAYGVEAMPKDGMMLDVGPRSLERIHAAIDDAATLVWNGPLGAFELSGFDRGTVGAAKHAAARTKAKKLVSVAGGGDTVAALNVAGVADDFTYVSTAGGAFLEWLEGKPLPGVEALKRKT